MKEAKPHNSVLFLTTLGVYLGLILVGGAAPQVYAHAAMTRNFEIADEIETRDEIDTDPDVALLSASPEPVTEVAEPAGGNALIQVNAFDIIWSLGFSGLNGEANDALFSALGFEGASFNVPAGSSHPISDAVGDPLFRERSLYARPVDEVRLRALETARSHSYNDQSFVVSRLPRAGLISSFARNAR